MDSSFRGEGVVYLYVHALHIAIFDFHTFQGNPNFHVMVKKVAYQPEHFKISKQTWKHYDSLALAIDEPLVHRLCTFAFHINKRSCF